MLHDAADWLAGFALRTVQILIESSLYLLIGFLTAGLLRGMVGPARIRRLFGTGRVAAPLRAWLAATTLLPVCALGVLPVLRELRRAGVPRHAVLTFALAAPMLNPISLISCLSYLGPNLLALLLVGTMLVSVGAGVIMGDDPARSPPEYDPAIGEWSDGPGHLGSAAVLAARTATGAIWVDIAAGMLGASLLAASLPESYLAESFFAGDHWAIGRMAAVAPLTYATPDKAMVALPEMIKFRQSAGAMFALVALGVGLTLGHATWAGRTYGPWATARWAAVVALASLAIAHAVAGIIPAVGTANSDNDHFAEFANPFLGMGRWPDLAGALGRYARNVEPLRWATVAALAGLIGAGASCRRAGKVGAPRLARSEAPLGNSAWNRPAPPRLVASVGAFVLGAVGLVGVYAYFPPPSEVFADMNIIKADFFGELSWPTLDPARHHLDLWERQASKLAVGSLIRLQPADEEAKRQTEALRAALHRLRLALDANRPAEARSLSLAISEIQGRCRQAYHVAW